VVFRDDLARIFHHRSPWFDCPLAPAVGSRRTWQGNAGEKQNRQAVFSLTGKLEAKPGRDMSEPFGFD